MDVDKKLRTDKQVFSILEPHHGYYYGDVAITFRQELMFHLDANFSCQTGTSFHSQRVYALQPWWTDPDSEDKRIKHFHQAKLHCSYPRYEYVAAAELISTTGKSKKTMNVNLDNIKNHGSQVDSHFVFKGHLPALIPLDYVENIYVPKNLFKSLTKESQILAREIFRTSLVLVEHDVNLSLMKGTVIPLDSTRKPYLSYILEELDKKIQERIKAPHLSRCIFITVPETRFTQYIVLPMTITQSYNLYCLTKGKPKTNIESMYVYWQAMDGDTM